VFDRWYTIFILIIDEKKNEEDNCLDQTIHLFMASNNQERCIYLIPPAVYNDHDKRRERDVYSLEIFEIF
jgi:hypothetical protein